MVHHAPLFPSLLALWALVGVDPMSGARIVNALAFGLIVFGSGQLLLRVLQSSLLAALGAAAALVSWPLLRVSTMAWSEPLFALLVIAFISALSRLLDTGKWRWLAVTGAVAALACLQRYVGVALVASGGVMIVFCLRNRRLLMRIAFAAVFGVASSLPIGLWLVRNHVRTDTFMGTRPESQEDLLSVTGDVLRVLGSWLRPGETGLWLAAFGVGVSALAVPAAVRALRRRSDGSVAAGAQGSPPLTSAGRATRREVTAAATVVLVFLGFMVRAELSVGMDRVNDRLLAPVYVPMIVVILSLAQTGILRLSARPTQRALATTVVAVLCLLWLWTPARRVCAYTERCAADGAGGYNTVRWRESSILHSLQYVRWRDPPRVYCNEPYAMYILAGQRSRSMHAAPRDAVVFRHWLSRGTPIMVVWLRDAKSRGIRSPEELRDSFRVKEVFAVADGSIYSVRLGAGFERREE